MKTISIRELHDQTGQWVRRSNEEQEIIITDRGRAIAVLHPLLDQDKPKFTWKNRPLHAAYQALFKSGKLIGRTNSSKAVAEDREAWR